MLTGILTADIECEGGIFVSLFDCGKVRGAWLGLKDRSVQYNDRQHNIELLFQILGMM
jgi:hypothetical protein